MNPTPFQVPGLDELNTLLPAFHFTALLSANDVSAVFMARQRSLDRDVAIKLLSPQISGNPEFRQSFETTARTMARLNHPNLIGVFDSGYVEGMLYFIMEFVPGKSLGHSSKGQQVDVMQSLRLIEAIADGLSHAHAHGIFHGELDPGDILLNQKAEPKIGNFGFSHPLETAEGHSPFAAPELRNGAAPDAKSDIYAVGALLYQLVTGHPHAEGAAPPSTLCACGPALDAVWKQATHPDPASRQPDMAGFRKAVTELAKSRPAGPAPARATPPISQRMAVAPRKTDQARPAQSPRTVVQKPKGPNWKLALNVILNLVLLGSLPFAWKHMKESRARKEREFNEQAAREKASQTEAESTPPPAPLGAGTTPKAPEPPRPVPKPAAPSETSAESLARLKDSLAAGRREEMPVGSVAQGDSSYLLISDPMSWPEAAGFAELHGGHLAIPSAGADLTWLSSTIAGKRAIWIGAARNGRTTWALADGSPWSPKKEPGGAGTYVCVDRSGSLRAEAGNTKLPFVIQWRMDGSNPGGLPSILAKTRATLGASSPVYPPGTVSSEKRHYLYVAMPVTWRQAVDLSETSGGHLIVAAEPAEISAVSSLIDSFSAPHGIWMGGFRKGDQWVWVTGEPWKTAGWNKSGNQGTAQSALVTFPMRGWDDRDLTETASGFIIEWSDDHKTVPQTPAKTPPGNATDTGALANKAKGLIAAADQKRTEQLKINAKKLPWDLDIYLRSLSKGEQAIWASHVERLKASVVNHRVPAGIPDSSGIKLTAKMAEVARFCADKQARIDAEFLAEAEKIRAAYVSRLKESIANARKAGETATAQSLEEAFSAASDLEEWVRSLGIEPKPENPDLGRKIRPGSDPSTPAPKESPFGKPLFE